MSDVTLDINVEAQSVYAALERMDTGFSATAWAVFLSSTVGPYLQERARARFSHEGDDVTGPWRPLKISTNQFRMAQGFPAEHPINVRTGEMERYITGGQTHALPLGPVAQLTFPDPARPMDSELREKVTTAQQGKANPATPPRPVIGLNTTDAMFILSAMSVYAKEVTGGRP